MYYLTLSVLFEYLDVRPLFICYSLRLYTSQVLHMPATLGLVYVPGASHASDPRLSVRPRCFTCQRP